MLSGDEFVRWLLGTEAGIGRYYGVSLRGVDNVVR